MFNPTPETEAASPETEQTRLQELALTSIELARIVASNPNAAPELLVHLAYSKDKQTRQNIVSNPNTPTNLLLKLGAEFPQELINNPIFSLLMLENPNLVEEMPAPTLASLLKIDVAPPGWMFAAAKHDDIDVLNLLLNNPDTPKKALKILIDRTDYDIRVIQTARLHIALQKETNQDWQKAAYEELKDHSYLNHDCFKEEALWEIGIIPENLFTALDEQVKDSIINNLSSRRISDITTIATVDSIFHQERILYTHALNDQTHSEVIEHIFNSEFQIFPRQRINEAIADNPNTPVDILEKLAVIEGKVRLKVFLNFKTPLQLLLKIFEYEFSVKSVNKYQRHSDEFQRIAKLTRNQTLNPLYTAGLYVILAGHPNTPSQVLSDLIKYSKSVLIHGKEIKEKIIYKISLLVAQNSRTPLETLDYLLENSARDIREAVVANLQTKQIKNNPQLQDFLIEWKTVQNLNTTTEQLQELATSKWLHIREAVVYHPNTTATILEQMAPDKRIPVRLAIAQNIKTHVTVFPYLIKQSNSEILLAVAENPNTPLSILEEIIYHRQKYQHARKAAIINLFQRFPEQASQALVNYVESSRATSTKLFLILHPIAPQDYLVKYVSSPNWRLRYAVAQNINTPSHIREHLINDANWIVRAAARANINKDASI